METSNLLQGPFAREQFDPKAYAQDLFAAQQGEDIRTLRQKLSKLQDAADCRIKETIFNNYPDLIRTAKAIAKLELETAQLKAMLNDMSSTVRRLSSLNISYDVQSEQDGCILETLPARPSSGMSKTTKDLNQLITERRFEEAVAALQELNAKEDEDVLQMMSHRLVKVLLAELNVIVLQQQDVKFIVSLLSRLGASVKAARVFLRSQSCLLAKQINNLRFEEDIVIFITFLTSAVIETIQRSFFDFLACFTDAVLSMFVSWANHEVVLYTHSLESHLSTVHSVQVLCRCVALIIDKWNELAPLGLGMLFRIYAVVAQIFSRWSLRYLRRNQYKLLIEIQRDEWCSSYGAATVSARQCGEILCSYAKHAHKFQSIEVKLADKCVATSLAKIEEFVKWYYHKVAEAVGSRPLSQPQIQGLCIDLKFLEDNVSAEVSSILGIKGKLLATSLQSVFVTASQSLKDKLKK